MSMLENAIKTISPRWARNRAEARVRLSRCELEERSLAALAAGGVFGGGAYSGASGKHSMVSWKVSSNDADSDLLPELPLLRDRSQDLYRNSAAGRGSVSRLVTGVIGAGLAVRSVVDRNLLGLSADEARAWSDAAEREFSMWSRSRDCDFSRRVTFAEMQQLAMRSQKLRGDCFAILRWTPREGVPYDLRVHLVEADRVCNPDEMPDDDVCAGGIERDSDGAPVAIHVRTVHPGSLLSTKLPEWNRVPIYGPKTGRRQVLHLMEFERIDQSRGEPILAPVIETLKQMARYAEAELSAAVVNAILTVFFKHPMEGDYPSGGEIAYSDEQRIAWQNRKIALGPGTMIDGAPGEDMQIVSANRPNAQFDPFFTACLKQIGMAVGVPFEVLVQHFSASYSASRAAILEYMKFVRTVRSWFINNFCQPVYEEFLTEAVIKGRLDAPGFLDDPVIRYAYCKSEWMGPSSGQIDPVKEVEAAKKRVDYGFSTFGRETAEISGADFEQNAYALQEERRLLDELSLDVDQGHPGVAPPPSPGGSGGEEENEKDADNAE